MELDVIIYDLLLILLVGLVAGVLSQRLRFPVVVGYLVGGCLLGPGGFAAVGLRHHEIEVLGELGVFFLLFSIGLEISPAELMRLGRRLFVGGTVQMSLVAVPVASVLIAGGVAPRPAVLLALALSFSSTVLVFQALSEQSRSTDHIGRRLIGILLFQDAVLVPLLLAVPLLVGGSQSSLAVDLVLLLGRSAAFGGLVFALDYVVPRYVLPVVCRDRSTASLVLSSLVILGGVTRVAHLLGLPPVVGAFFAGLVLGGNRWTAQIDAVVLPFREAFAAVFFTSLGLLLQPGALWQAPLSLALLFASCVIVKWLAAVVALRWTGLSWALSMRTGAGLAHVGEFAFVVGLAGLDAGLITPQQYGALIAVGLLTLVVTPPALRRGLSAVPGDAAAGDAPGVERDRQTADAVVIGAGPVGRRVASTLEMGGVDVCVVDASPVNLHAFAQAGFRTVAGDAVRPHILAAAGVRSAGLVVVCIPEDDAAKAIVREVRQANETCRVLVRCRYQGSAEELQRLGSDEIVSEEVLVSRTLVQMLRE